MWNIKCIFHSLNYTELPFMDPMTDEAAMPIPGSSTAKNIAALKQEQSQVSKHLIVVQCFYTKMIRSSEIIRAYTV